ncbi:MAG: tRNA 2-selenouridine(34) synthase MnmH [Cyanobacteriota bacterium]|nr:tRNA 2-selenouridine(34) synthase MnmH [Cyanobacteriota bacterium]
MTRCEPEEFLEARGPVVDVRSPGEFQQGHIPGALNLPLFSDQDRADVGTTYRQQGRQQAILLGLRLVGPNLEHLGRQLQQALAGHGPDGVLRMHCWRGGLRSDSLAWLAGTLGLPVVLLDGGYKRYRRWALEQFETPWPLTVLAGRTGTGKTDLLLAIAALGMAVVDLEDLAHHRGSSFGGLGLPPQPTSEHFENKLALALWNLRKAPEIWIEAESAQVGRCRIPAALWRQMGSAPAVEISRTLGERLERLVAVYGHQGREALQQATERIARKLGPQRSRAALAAIACDDWSAACAEMLDYYDRCYDHELSRRGAQGVRQLDLSGLSDAQAAQKLAAGGWR